MNCFVQDDYDDEWAGAGETMAEFNSKKHHFVHKNVKPTEPMEEGSEKYLARLRRETDEIEGIVI